VAEPVRFFFDEHVPDAAANALRARGVDVLTADEAGRLSLPDDDQLRFATSGGRVVVTHDTDYLTFATAFQTAGEAFAGVAYCPPTKYVHNVGGLVRALLTLHGVYTADDMRDRVEYL
jgi:hypothetical protein